MPTLIKIDQCFTELFKKLCGIIYGSRCKYYRSKTVAGFGSAKRFTQLKLQE